VKIIDQQLLDNLSAEARVNPRRRKNFNLHPSDDFCCHRLFNALEPDTYIRPHRHLDPVKDETFMIVRGKLGVIMFDVAGIVLGHVVLVPGGEAVAVDMPHGAFHSAVSLEPGTVFFEAKAGPYRPLTAEETAPWAPAEGTPEAADYLAMLKKHITG
jgi:cupin fold WbuC family metalloprotein